jgi:UDP-glucose 4-epimerase
MSRAINLSGQRVAVTGATGFLGGHILRHLQAAQASIVAVVDRNRSSSRHHANLEAPGLETLWFDRPQDLANTVQAASPDYVIHLHAVVTTQRSAEAVRSTLDHNLLPSLDLMIACGEMSVKRLILMGSGEEFGPVTGPFDDSTIADPPSPYGASKAAVTCYAKMFHRAFNLPVMVLRPSVVYGPFQSPRMLVPQVMKALMEGHEIAVTEGRQTRDFIHVDDVARGVLCALTAEGITGNTYNLGSGEVVTVKDCLTRMEAISGRPGLIKYGAIPYKQGEIFSYEPLVESSYSALGWRPLITLDNGLAKTWESLKMASIPSESEAAR